MSTQTQTQYVDPNDRNVDVVSSITAAPVVDPQATLAAVTPPPPPPPPPPPATFTPSTAIDLKNPAPNQDWFSPIYDALDQARNSAVSQYTDIANNLRPKPSLLDKIGGWLSHIPIVGDIANTIITGEEFVFNKINHAVTGQDVFGDGGVLQGTSDWRANQTAAGQRLYQMIEEISGKMEQLESIGKDQFNAQINTDKTNSLDHRAQLINSGFYTKSQVENGLGHPLAGGGFYTRIAAQRANRVAALQATMPAFHPVEFVPMINDSARL
jgi:hypothetical protein